MQRNFGPHSLRGFTKQLIESATSQGMRAQEELDRKRWQFAKSTGANPGLPSEPFAQDVASTAHQTSQMLEQSWESKKQAAQQMEEAGVDTSTSALKSGWQKSHTALQEAYQMEADSKEAMQNGIQRYQTEAAKIREAADDADNIQKGNLARKNRNAGEQEAYINQLLLRYRSK